MTVELVTVTAQWDDGISSNGYGSGNFMMVASGHLISASQVAIVTPYIDGQLDSLGSLSLEGTTAGSGIPLLASDSPGFAAGALTWNFKIIVQGMPQIIANDIPVYYALGATQNLITILEAGGWTPITI